MAGKGHYDIERLNQRLRIVFGKAEAIRRNIDTSLMQDDYHRRRRNMRTLGVPTRFPDPKHMDNSPTNKWIHWINTEAEKLQAEISEEIKQKQEPDNPFDGTAGGVFQPLVQDLTETGHNTENNIPAINEESQVSEIEKEPTALPQISQTLIDIDFDTVPKYTQMDNKDPNVNRQLIPNIGTPKQCESGYKTTRNTNAKYNGINCKLGGGDNPQGDKHKKLPRRNIKKTDTKITKYHKEKRHRRDASPRNLHNTRNRYRDNKTLITTINMNRHRGKKKATP